MRSTLVTVCILLVASLVGACKSNPYEGKPALAPLTVAKPTPTPSPSPTPAPTPTPSPLPTFSLDAPDVMKFTVGSKGEYIVRGTVPPPGSPQISFKTLPTGASYDSTTQKLTWTPKAADVNTYVVDIRLKSSADPINGIVKTVVMLVERSTVTSLTISPGRTTVGNNSVSFQMLATGPEDYPQWTVEGNSSYQIQTTYLEDAPQTVLTVNWQPKSSSDTLKIKACEAECSSLGVEFDGRLVFRELGQTGGVQ